MAPVLAAEFTAGSKTRPARVTLNVIRNGARRFVSEHPVAGKREARANAAQLGFKPWNF
jgi:hypothetical protein